LWLGSITQRLLTHAGSPVVAVGAGTAAPVPGTVARVLVGVEDGGSPHAFAFAFEEAQQRDVRLLAVRVVPPVEWPTPSSPVPAQVIPDAEKQLSRTLIPWHALHPDVHLTPIVQSGRPGGTLVAMCRPDDLLVLGHRRRTSLTPRQLGPVVSAALHAAPCPVAIVLDPAANATG
jgi:nucleotide-binding universal stress UspA family protein